MPITLKLYQCPLCGNMEKHSTNHFGEIYSVCRKCKNLVLYCVEPKALAERRKLPTITTTFHSYRYDLERHDEKALYYAFRDKMLLECMETYCEKTWEGQQKLLSYNGEEITLYTHQLFDNQWITNIGRLFDWKQFIYPNKKIKSGYYLDITDEMNELRNSRIACNYCGTQMDVGQQCKNESPICEQFGMRSLRTRYKKMLIILARREPEYIRTNHHGAYRVPEYTERQKPVALVYSSDVSRFAEAEAFAKKEGYTIFVMHDTEDVLDIARKKIME